MHGYKLQKTWFKKYAWLNYVLFMHGYSLGTCTYRDIDISLLKCMHGLCMEQNKGILKRHKGMWLMHGLCIFSHRYIGSLIRHFWEFQNKFMALR